jgi:hypothetical protein
VQWRRLLMLALLIDNDFRETILKGLLTREPRIDLLRLRDVGLRQAPDPDVLQWAADRVRVVVTHDVNTMVGFAYDRVSRHLPMPGVIAVAQDMPVGQAIEELHLATVCHESDELEKRVLFLPL